MSTKYVWDMSQKLFNHRWMFFRGMPNFLKFCLLASGHYFRVGTLSEYPHRLLERLLTFRGSEGSIDVVLCTT